MNWVSTILSLDKRAKWWFSPKGWAWKERNRARRNAYHRAYYQKNKQARRSYLNAKQRQYRTRPRPETVEHLSR